VTVFALLFIQAISLLEGAVKQKVVHAFMANQVSNVPWQDSEMLFKLYQSVRYV